ncbi:MAG: hypothetical protein CVV25_10030 [Ignavibacteriae bacterium HGW-Ignavibacteriae-4]|nr:MAG: hypothetical protein CVV25_10030 [Ignavibacteriae bacterium HGW-Ignavibacteriae-4]
MMSSSNIGDPYSKYEIENGTFEVEYLSNTVLKDIPGDSEYRVLIYNLPLYTSAGTAFTEITMFTYAVYLFEDEKLIFFGFPEDYLKSDDEKINRLGMKLATLIRTTNEES